MAMKSQSINKKLMKMFVAGVMMIFTDSNMMNTVVATSIDGNSGLLVTSLTSQFRKDLYDATRRRLKRSADDSDYRTFRQYVHNRSRERRFGAANIVKRDSNVFLMERANPRASIAASVDVGECKLKSGWVTISKPGCRKYLVKATLCMGMCESFQIPDINPPFTNTVHRSCKPTKVVLKKIRLVCAPGVNNVYTLSSATSCACSNPSSQNTACQPLL